MGSWVVYGLGSEAEALPAYVVMPDSHGAQEAGVPMYTNGFLRPCISPPCFVRAQSRCSTSIFRREFRLSSAGNH